MGMHTHLPIVSLDSTTCINQMHWSHQDDGNDCEVLTEACVTWLAPRRSCRAVISVTSTSVMLLHLQITLSLHVISEDLFLSVHENLRGFRVSRVLRNRAVSCIVAQCRAISVSTDNTPRAQPRRDRSLDVSSDENAPFDHLSISSRVVGNDRVLVNVSQVVNVCSVMNSHVA